MNNSQSQEITHSNFFNEDFRWLEETMLHVKKAYKLGKIAHGLLLAAPKESGKSLFATTLASSILCSNSNDSTSMLEQKPDLEQNQTLAKACGQCKNCRWIEAASHPDLSIVDCLVDNKGKQKKSIGIDQIRQLTDKLIATPQLGGWRIAIIMSVEKMTRGAFNAILKTLEEPGDKTLLLLLANSTHQVPATIKSRCQLLSLKLSENNVLSWLTKATSATDIEAKHALSETLYAPFAAKSFIENKEHDQNRQFSHDMDAVLQTKLLPQEFISLYSALNDVLWIQMANYFKKTLVSILKSNQGIYSKLPKTQVSQLYSELIEYNRAQCSGSNLQVNLQLETVLIQWFEIGRKIGQY
ncbi:MAG: hypothetical protein L3J46_09770 [Kangiellaceae bacterium]|nr:hypothetical protein [Kangiellaceae bacterium]